MSDINSRAIFYRSYQDIWGNTMWRVFRILLGSLFYLIASLVLIISLKCYPKELRQQAKDNFL